MQDLAHISPLLIVTFIGLLVLIVGVFAPRDSFKGWLGYVSVAGLTLALGATLWVWNKAPVSFEADWLGMAIVVDGFACAMWAITIIGAILTTLSAIHYLPQQRSDHPEYYALVMFASLGMMGLGAANDLLTLFVALEVMSMAIYVLAGFKRQSPFSIEAALKYFILGSFASAILLMGMAYVYGVTGTLHMGGPDGIGAQLASTAMGAVMGAESAPTMASFGMLLMLGAFAFKIAAAPFHMWTPDVYEGAPSSATGFMAVGVKVAAFAALARVLLTCFPHEYFRSGPLGWETFIAGLAVISMFAGNLMAIAQKNLKRILAYSAIAHTGYLLIAFVAQPPATGGASSGTFMGGGLIFYLLAYTVANAGAFAVAAAVGGKDREDLDERAYAGLARRKPLLGLALAICVLSLLGIPTTAGFIGKLKIFGEALETGGAAAQGNTPEYLWLVIVAVVNSLISAWYYLRIIVTAFMRPEDEKQPIATFESRPLAWAAGLAALATMVLGLLPGSSLEASNKAGLSLAGKPAVSSVASPEGPANAVQLEVAESER